MKAMKWVGIVMGAYAVLVVLFETVYLGWQQPKLEATGIPMLVVTTTDESGESRDRRLARLETEGQVYVSAHHWTRGWYHRAVANPEVRVEIDGTAGNYVAVPLEGEELDRIAEEFPIPLFMRFLMGFPPPRDILRLDPTS